MSEVKKPVFLVVDDDGQVREILIQYLRSFGHTNILQAKNGKAAIKIIQNPAQKIDIVISDWEMPHIDGLTLLRAIRKDPVRSEIKFLMVSSQGSHERMKISKAAKSHVDAYLVKPFRAHDLKAKIDKLVSGEPDESAKHFDAVFANAPQSVTGTTLTYDLKTMKVDAIHELILAHQRVGELDKAVALACEALKHFPGSIEIEFGLGVTHFLRSDYENSKIHLLKVLKVEPDHKEAKAFLSEITGQDAA
jgi:two-component system chemotaxis response regulator CheY